MYPFPLLHGHQSIFPLFGDQLKGSPHIFDFSSRNPTTLTYDTRNFDRFQSLVFDELESVQKEWGIGGYLVERKNVLRDYPQIIEEGRFIHVGVDIVIPAGLSLHAPLSGTVYQTGKEEGVGNYGGYTILKHEEKGTTFYTFYGHLSMATMPSSGTVLEPGDIFGTIGDGNDSGGWFTHVHFQVLTEKAVQDGRAFQGYVSIEDLPGIEELFPNPYPLFRY